MVTLKLDRKKAPHAKKTAGEINALKIVVDKIAFVMSYGKLESRGKVTAFYFVVHVRDDSQISEVAQL